MLRGWTELFRIESNEGVDQRQVKWVRTQSESIEGTGQGARGMLGGSFRRKNANQRTAQRIGDDPSIIFYLRLDAERIWHRRTLEAQCLPHQAEHIERTIAR